MQLTPPHACPCFTAQRRTDQRLNPPQLLAFFSMVDARKRLHRELTQSLAAEHDELLHAAIPNAADIERMGVHRTVVDRFAPNGRAASAYHELWQEIRRRLAGDRGE